MLVLPSFTEFFFIVHQCLEFYLKWFSICGSFLLKFFTEYYLVFHSFSNRFRRESFFRRSAARLFTEFYRVFLFVDCF